MRDDDDAPTVPFPVAIPAPPFLAEGVRLLVDAGQALVDSGAMPERGVARAFLDFAALLHAASDPRNADAFRALSEDFGFRRAAEAAMAISGRAPSFGLGPAS